MFYWLFIRVLERMLESGVLANVKELSLDMYNFYHRFVSREKNISYSLDFFPLDKDWVFLGQGILIQKWNLRGNMSLTIFHGWIFLRLELGWKEEKPSCWKMFCQDWRMSSSWSSTQSAPTVCSTSSLESATTSSVLISASPNMSLTMEWRIFVMYNLVFQPLWNR